MTEQVFIIPAAHHLNQTFHLPHLQKLFYLTSHMSGTMRITGGSLVRRRFQVPKAADLGLVRPTTDKVREAIFSSLGTQIYDAQILDLFAGSGAYCFESISRGAKSAIAIEMSRETASCIRENAKSLGIETQFQLFIDDATRWITRAPLQNFDVVFVDPPYTLKLSVDFWTHLIRYIATDGIAVFRCKELKEFNCPPGYQIVRERAYGGTAVFFLTRNES